MEENYDILIIGAGPAGLSAALYGARAGYRVLLLEKIAAGGQMLLTGQIENYPGTGTVSGFDLAQKMLRSAQDAGAEIRYENAEHIDPSAKTVTTRKGTYRGKALILAMGASPRKLGLEGEDRLTGHGVHYCAHCDGNFYRGKTVIVVGGGNSALQDALYLSGICQEVILIHRRDAFRAAPALVTQAKNAENIRILTGCTVTALLGEETLTGVQAGSQTIPCDALFIAVGYTPATEIVAAQLPTDPDGSLPGTHVGIPGVFAAGDVRKSELHQIITAAADGAAAAVLAMEYLQNP